LSKRRREYKYELKKSLNIQPGESAEHVIATSDPQYISYLVDFEAEVRHWCDPKVQVTIYIYIFITIPTFVTLVYLTILLKICRGKPFKIKNVGPCKTFYTHPGQRA
jgi:hypothetical protein